MQKSSCIDTIGKKAMCYLRSSLKSAGKFSFDTVRMVLSLIPPRFIRGKHAPYRRTLGRHDERCFCRVAYAKSWSSNSIDASDSS